MTSLCDLQRSGECVMRNKRRRRIGRRRCPESDIGLSSAILPARTGASRSIANPFSRATVIGRSIFRRRIVEIWCAFRALLTYPNEEPADGDPRQLADARRRTSPNRSLISTLETPCSAEVFVSLHVHGKTHGFVARVVAAASAGRKPAARDHGDLVILRMLPIVADPINAGTIDGVAGPVELCVHLAFGRHRSSSE